MKVCVVGGGINGMTCAYFIKKAHCKIDVTIISKDYSPDTTSDVAAGWWKPFLCGKTPTSVIYRWSKDTYDYAYNVLKNDKNALKIGISESQSFLMTKENNIEKPFWHDFVFDFRLMEEKDVKRFSKDLNAGYAWTSMYVEGTKYMAYLRAELGKLGVPLIQRKIENFNELYKDYDVIINCAGLGNYFLLDDKEMFPIRGQVLKAKAPWMNESVIIPDVDDPNLNTYILPNQDWVILGGTQQQNNWDTKPSDKDTQWILGETQKLFPSLKGVEIMKKCVGLRPARSSVRLERENIADKHSKRIIKFIHNYGHGGSGLTLFWGCAHDVLKLFDEILHEEEKSKL